VIAIGNIGSIGEITGGSIGIDGGCEELAELCVGCVVESVVALYDGGETKSSCPGDGGVENDEGTEIKGDETGERRVEDASANSEYGALSRRSKGF
jgi:hypothetical protein